MFKINREIREHMIWVRNKLKRTSKERTIIDILQGMVAELRAENVDLRNRLMARNFEELQIYSPGMGLDTLPKPIAVSDPLYDEENAGEVLDYFPDEGRS